MRAFLLFGVMVLSAGAAVSAEQSPATPLSTTKFGALRPAQSADPYRTLFETQNVLTEAVQSAPKADPQPAVVCGMTIIPADPSIDPKMLFPRKADGVDYKIRVITPAICNPSR